MASGKLSTSAKTYFSTRSKQRNDFKISKIFGLTLCSYHRLVLATNTAPTRSSSLHLHFKSFSPFRPMRAQLDRNLEMQVSTSQSFASTTGTIWVFCLVGKNTKPEPRSTLKAEVTSPRECALAREIQVAFLSPTHKHRLLFVAFLTRRRDNYHKNVCPSKSIFLAAIFPIIVIIVLR
jgi:hypothetical protein